MKVARHKLNELLSINLSYKLEHQLENLFSVSGDACRWAKRAFQFPILIYGHYTTREG